MSVFELWLPILLGGIAVHVAATLAWTVLPHHKPEWPRLDAEEDLLSWLGEKQVSPGQYLFPHPEASEGKDPGCRGRLVLLPAPPNMGANIGLTLGFFLASTFVIGYLASLGLPRGAAFIDVFQFVFTAGFLTHVFAGIPTIIWFRRKCLMDFVDGFAYSLILAALFAGMWPAAA